MRHDSKVTANGLYQREEEESSSDDFGRFKNLREESAHAPFVKHLHWQAFLLHHCQKSYRYPRCNSPAKNLHMATKAVLIKQMN